MAAITRGIREEENLAKQQNQQQQQQQQINQDNLTLNARASPISSPASLATQGGRAGLDSRLN